MEGETLGSIRQAKDGLQRASEGLQKIWAGGEVRLLMDWIESFKEDIKWIENELPLIKKTLADFEAIALKEKVN